MGAPAPVGGSRPVAGVGAGSSDEPDTWRSMVPHVFAGRGGDSGLAKASLGGITAPLLHRRAVTALGFVHLGGAGGGSLAFVSASADGSLALTSVAGELSRFRGVCARP